MRDYVIVPSFTDGDKSYAVTKTPRGLSCDCPSAKVPCKHSALVARADEMIARCGAAHGTNGVLCRTCFVAILATAAKKVVDREKKLVREVKESTKEKMKRRRSRKLKRESRDAAQWREEYERTEALPSGILCSMCAEEAVSKAGDVCSSCRQTWGGSNGA